MRTEAEIKDKIQQLRKWQASVPPREKRYIEMLKWELCALMWVMGDDTRRYYCFDCHVVHDGLRCPVCGDATERTPE